MLMGLLQHTCANESASKTALSSSLASSPLAARLFLAGISDKLVQLRKLELFWAIWAASDHEKTASSLCQLKKAWLQVAS